MQIERFCALYNIRAVTLEENVLYPLEVPMTDPAALAAAAAAGMAVPSPTGLVALPSYVDPTATAAAAAAAAVSNDMSKLKKGSESAKGPKKIVDMERLENEQRQSKLREQRRLSQERKEQRAKDREAVAVKKASERAAREATREERRRKKVEIRQQREKFAQVSPPLGGILSHQVHMRLINYNMHSNKKKQHCSVQQNWCPPTAFQ